jgi:hypothetical protein
MLEGGGLKGSARQGKETVVFQEIAAVLGLRATTGIATSALPCAPVLPVPERRQLARHVLRGLRPRRGR